MNSSLSFKKQTKYFSFCPNLCDYTGAFAISGLFSSRKCSKCYMLAGTLGMENSFKVTMT
ncbi:hypothetical protein T07_3688 [Trichinella nelsoni]|uniref:Uncharacterized protein n=1 Tax=Trichinella nelsoni TaxID=6336 RepID=A0A0V0SHA6_9BILA|nr:hypothetical protein T07_3688 [Trichinella nelsoni]